MGQYQWSSARNICSLALSLCLSRAEWASNKHARRVFHALIALRDAGEIYGAHFFSRLAYWADCGFSALSATVINSRAFIVNAPLRRQRSALPGGEARLGADLKMFNSFFSLSVGGGGGLAAANEITRHEKSPCPASNEANGAVRLWRLSIALVVGARSHFNRAVVSARFDEPHFLRRESDFSPASAAPIPTGRFQQEP